MERTLPGDTRTAGGDAPCVRVALCAAGEIWGGVERFVLTFALALRAVGIRVLVVLFHDGPLAQQLRTAGIALEILDQHSKYDLRQIARLDGILTAHRIELVHVHGYRATIAAAVPARLRGIPTVKTEHGRLEPHAEDGPASPQVRMRASLWLDRLATRYFVRAVAFVSHDMRRSIGAAGRGVVHEVIHNGVERPEDGGQPSTVLTDAAFDRAHFHIGIVGRLAAVKGHRYLIDAVQRLSHLPDLRLHVFGSGPLDAACRAQCHDAGGRARVVFHGFRDDIPACLRSLDVLAMPSLQEGLPYALLEAMAARLPVVASDLPGIREVFPDGEAHGAILVPPRNASALAAAVARLHGDRDLRRRMGEAAHERLSDAFRADRMVERYLRLYSRALARAS